MLILDISKKILLVNDVDLSARRPTSRRDKVMNFSMLTQHTTAFRVIVIAKDTDFQ